MGWRLDASVVAAECILELERAASSAGDGVVGTVGHAAFEPGLINLIPEQAILSLDIRGTDDSAFLEVARHISVFADEVAKRRGMTAEYVTHQTLPATQMDRGVVRALEMAAASTGEPYKLIPSGVAHDTMCLAEHVPSAMLFVPCKDCISHSPEEEASPADAALAAETVLEAIRALQAARAK